MLFVSGIIMLPKREDGNITVFSEDHKVKVELLMSHKGVQQNGKVL